MAWRTVTENDLSATLSQEEIDAFRATSPGGDAVASQIADTVAYVRGLVRSSPARVRLDPDDSTLPASLIRPAMDYLRFGVLTIANAGEVSQSRTLAYNKACELFELIRRGEFVPESAGGTDGAGTVAGTPSFAPATPRRLCD